MSTIPGDGATQAIYLQMNVNAVDVEYSVGSLTTPSSTWTIIPSWPVTITNTATSPGPSTILRAVVTQDLTISVSTGGNVSGYFQPGSTYVTFDGSGNTILFNFLFTYNGFIKNSVYANVAVQNFITNTTNSTLDNGAGWLCQNSFGGNILGNSITNCTNNAVINVQNAGGICGQTSGSFNGSLTITNCTNNAVISGEYAGGIVGFTAGSSNGSLTITNCTNNGNITAQYAGGIGGASSGTIAGSVTITTCINTGNITGQYAGGIVGQDAGLQNGLVIIRNCFSIGDINGNQAGGIAGARFGGSTSANCIISGCYSTGDIKNAGSGGIVGGDIARSFYAIYTPVVDISNCYSLGNIATLAGGICGGGGVVYTYPGTIQIQNCYSAGTLVDASSGLVSVILATPNLTITTSDTYVAGFVGGTNWTDASANASLTGTPTSINTNNPGATWMTFSTGSPYMLASYNTAIYNPSSVSTFIDYTSSPGLFQSGYTYKLLSMPPSSSTAIARVIVSQGTSPKYYSYSYNTFTLTNLNGGWGRPIATTINESTGVLNFILPYPCFLEGTKILCFENNEEVYRPIESLRKGDLVKTIYNGYMPIYMIGTTSIYNPGNDYRVANRLYKCPKEKYPTLFEDLYITGCHSILVPWMTDDQWENTKAIHKDVYITDNHFRLIACADEKAEPYTKEGFMNIYHVALEHEDYYMNYGIYANGLLVESCSKRYLTEISNMRILGQEDSSVTEGGSAEENVFHKMPSLIESC